MLNAIKQVHSHRHTNTLTFTAPQKASGLIGRQVTCSLCHRAVWSASDRKINLRFCGDSESGGGGEEKHIGVTQSYPVTASCQARWPDDKQQEKNV